MPRWKAAIIGFAVAVWMVGLFDQLHDWKHTAKYLGLSALMVVVAVI